MFVDIKLYLILIYYKMQRNGQNWDLNDPPPSFGYVNKTYPQSYGQLLYF